MTDDAPKTDHFVVIQINDDGLDIGPNIILPAHAVHINDDGDAEVHVAIYPTTSRWLIEALNEALARLD